MHGLGVFAMLLSWLRRWQPLLEVDEDIARRERVVPRFGRMLDVQLLLDLALTVAVARGP